MIWLDINFSKIKYCFIIILIVLSPQISISEEGMWTFFSLPLKQLKEKYNFAPDKAWVDHVRLSTVQIDGGSGAFVSPDGLIMTNHHVVVGTASNVKNLNFVENGYYAKNRETEVKLPGLTASILEGIKNVTGEIESAYDKSMHKDTIKLKITEKTNQITQAANKENKLFNRVIYINNTGEYWLYSYKVLSDIRLVFAPEASVAAFGGYYNDNFTYPRYNLDVSFVRAYENDQPYKPGHYFKWKTAGAAENELVFIPGNPGHTNRFITSHEYEFMKNYKEKYSYIISKYAFEFAAERNFEGFDNNSVLHITNRHKINSGLKYCFDQPRNFQKLQDIHCDILEKLKNNSELLNEYLYSYNKIDSLVEILKDYYRQSAFRMKDMALYQHASMLYELIYELDTNKELTTLQENTRIKWLKKIEDTTLIKKENQVYALTKYLRYLIEENMADKLKLMEFTGFENTDTAAIELCNTKLFDKDFRLKILNGGAKALEACNDPFVKFVCRVENANKNYPDFYLDDIWSQIKELRKSIVQAYNEVYGNEKTPDANFTLRFSYGTVKSYFINGYNFPWKTTLYGLFDKSASHGNEGDYFLPKRVWESVDDINKSTPCNFVTTNDIIGGNSGSSVINCNAEVVGIVFDGNFESIIGEYVFDDTYSRAVCVHPAFIMEALRNIYDAGSLADEITGK